MKPDIHHPILSLLLGLVTYAGAVNFTSPYQENFNSMGTSGTSPPAGWSVFGAFTGGNATWLTSIPGSGVVGGTENNTVAATTLFTASSNTSGYNFALSSSTSDRCLGTSPTSGPGVALQLSLTNATGTNITSIDVGYDIRRFTAPANTNELPGYWLFYSLDGGATWANVASLNPTVANVPNTVGISTMPVSTISFGSAWARNSTLLFRWMDDNSNQSSPDQVIGLDNITIVTSGIQVENPPTVSLTAPLASDWFVAPATVNLAATANDTDGTVTRVEFFNGATKLGEDTTPPYTYAWSGVTGGNYNLTAKATDNGSNVTASAIVGITVNPDAGSGTLVRNPYLQQAGPTTMTLRWRSSQRVPGRVRYGVSAASLTNTADEASATTEHEVMLTGLTPDTPYFYSVGSAVDTLAGGDANHKFKTPPTAGTIPVTRIWVLGDAGTGTSSQTSVRDAFYTWTGAADPNFVLQLGDNAYNTGLDSEFQTKVFDIYGSLMRRVPFWSCLGNHETAQATSYVDTYPYFNIYTFPKAGQCGGVPSGTEHYYSFDYGNIHVISLDSMTADRSTGGAMATWLTNDLASTTSTWIICIFHHPPYTKGSHNSDTESQLIEMRANILPILEAGGVDLVLCGHSHSYERSYLLDGHYGLSNTMTDAMKKDAGSGCPAETGAYIKPLTGPRDHFGAVYAVAGSSGQISGGSLNHPAHFISLNNLGSLVLDVNGSRLDATFLRENGSTPDTFTMIKQGAADSDKDGIPDEYEIANNLNRFDAGDALLDPDHDGVTNRDEYLLGLHANAPDRYQWFTTRNPQTGQVEVTYPTRAGRIYQVDRSPNLLDWEHGSAEVSGDGTAKTWTDPESVPMTNGKRFYRVRVTGIP